MTESRAGVTWGQEWAGRDERKGYRGRMRLLEKMEMILMMVSWVCIYVRNNPTVQLTKVCLSCLSYTLI